MKAHRLALAAALTGTALLLTGCMSMEGDITLDGQALADGTLSVAINKEAASYAGIASLDSLERALQQQGSAGALGGGDVEFTETDTDYVATATFGGADLNDETWRTVINEDGQLEFSMDNQAEEADLASDPDFGRIDLTVNFPGEVLQYSGTGAEQIDADTMRWQLPLTESTTLAATSEVGSGSALPVVLGIAAAAGLLGAGVWVAGRRTASAGPEPVESPDPEQESAPAAL